MSSKDHSKHLFTKRNIGGYVRTYQIPTRTSANFYKRLFPFVLYIMLSIPHIFALKLSFFKMNVLKCQFISLVIKIRANNPSSVYGTHAIKEQFQSLSLCLYKRMLTLWRWVSERSVGIDILLHNVCLWPPSLKWWEFVWLKVYIANQSWCFVQISGFQNFAPMGH